MNNIKNHQGGMSLVEVLIAAVILVLAMIPLWGLMGSSHKQAMSSADELRVAQLASEVLEQIEAEVFVPSGNPTTIALDSNGNFDDGKIKNSPFPEYLDLKCEYKEDGDVMYIVMSYKEPDGKKRQYTLAGYKNK